MLNHYNVYFGPKRDTLGVCGMGSCDVDWEVLGELPITTCKLKCAAGWHIFCFNNWVFLFLLYREALVILLSSWFSDWRTSIHLMLCLYVLTFRLFLFWIITFVFLAFLLMFQYIQVLASEVLFWSCSEVLNVIYLAKDQLAVFKVIYTQSFYAVDF